MKPKNKTSMLKKIIALLSCVGVIATIAAVSTLLFASKENNSAIKIMQNSLMLNAPTMSDKPTQNISDPDREVRGVWIATVGNINFPSKAGLPAEELKAELDDIIKTVKSANLNTIYFQVRPSADALYNSDIFPTSAFLTGTQGVAFNGGFDPLAYLVETAHSNNIDVHAWVNPLRITYGSAAYPKHDVNELAANHPARLHPDWVVKYVDGMMYFNAGLPEVRQLISSGVAEIVKKYNVDGVAFDDYFYPYPKTVEKDGASVIAPYDDETTFKKYGANFKDKSDWRRDNINLIIKSCYEEIKTLDKNCEFGVAPFGIWQNDNGTNNGSDSAGLNSYSEIYCDALAWIKGGYIDYIAPQIYWQFSYSKARFDVLTRWWNQQLEQYPNVDLYISHAAYRSAEWEIQNEIKNQVEYARSERSYKGSIFYGYQQIKDNELNVLNQLVQCYKDEIIYTNILSNESPLNISTPINGGYVNADNTYLIGASDPAFPLYIDGKPVGRTKQGYFSLYLKLNAGENKFLFEHKGIKTVHIINKGKGTNPQPTGGSYTYTYPTMETFELQSISPASNYMIGGGESIKVKITAPAGSTVTAKLGSSTINLTPQTNPPKNATYVKEVYAGTITLPNNTADTQITDLGNIMYTANFKGEVKTATGANVRVAGKNVKIPVEIIKNDTELKIGMDSWYYDDFTPASIGMRDYAVRQENGFYKLRVNGYVSDKGTKELPANTVIDLAKISSAKMVVNDKNTELQIQTSQNVPLNGYIENGDFIFTLYNVDVATAKNIELDNKNPLFTKIRYENSTKPNSYKYFCTLVNVDNFYGFEFSYRDGNIIVSLRNPQILPTGNTPLAGKVIILDAGHGGKDTGAAGPYNKFNEADLNLSITLATAKKLEALGATVNLTRNENKTVDINWRMDYYSQIQPDLAVSIHQNSMTFDADITKIRGLIGLYYADSGKLLTKAVSKSVSNTLNRFERVPASQRLAMVRNPKFPSTLVEVSFITCVEEYDQMMRPNTIETTAQSVAQGILDFYAAQSKFIK